MTIQATAVFRVRTGGSNTNGGGYDAGLSGAGTDYSQQDAAQATGTHGTASGTTTFTDTTAAAFTALMVGNAIFISGTGFTAGVYWVTARASTTSITLDRSPGTGTTATWAIGGAWADPWTNIAATIVPGNTVYVRGSGSDAPTVDDYAHGAGSTVTIPNGDFAVGNIRFVSENGRARISSSTSLFILGTLNRFKGMYIAATAATAGSTGVLQGGGSSTTYYEDMVFDQRGFDVTMVNTPTVMIGGEVFSSIAPGSNGANFALFGVQESTLMVGVNIHDTVGRGVRSMGRLGNHIRYNIFAKCRGDALTLVNSTGLDSGSSVFYGNTFDANLGHGLNIGGAAALQQSSVFNNIFSNHTGAGKYAIYCNFLTTAQNDRIKGYFDYNNFFGNTNDLFQISHGANDTALDPQYVAQATEGYNIGTNLKAKGTPQTAFLNSASAFTPTATQAYIDIGGVQRLESPSTDIAASLGIETDAGQGASVSISTNVSATLGTVADAGLGAGVSLSTDIGATLGIETDAGLGATVGSGTVVSAGLGVETDAGQGATVSVPTTVSATLGGVSDAGQGATVLAATVIGAGLGTETDGGLPATINNTKIYGSIPVYLCSPPGAGPYPNLQSNVAGAIPVYEVAKPGPGARPNDQSKAAGAIPVRIVSAPVGNGPFPTDRDLNGGAIPVWVTGSATGQLPVYPTDQNNANGAIPVYLA